MANDYRGLGFDPVPGSPDAVDVASGRFQRAAEHAGTAADTVEHASHSLDAHGPDSWWSGGTAAAFVERLERAPAELAKARQILTAAAEIMDDWANTLRANQRRADRLDRAALELRRAIRTAADEVERAKNMLKVAIGSAARTAEAEHAVAKAKHDQLQHDLDRVLAAARVLAQDHLSTAQQVAARLRVLGGGGDGAQATGQVLSTEELFGGLVTTLGSFSAQAGGLAVTLLGSSHAQHREQPAAGAVGRLAAAIAGPPGDR